MLAPKSQNKQNQIKIKVMVSIKIKPLSLRKNLKHFTSLASTNFTTMNHNELENRI